MLTPIEPVLWASPSKRKLEASDDLKKNASTAAESTACGFGR